MQEAASAESAMARLEQEQFPIVVSDIYMAEKTGLDVLRVAKALNPSGAVILMTGKGTPIPQMGIPPNLAWWGAGVTTVAPIAPPK